VIDLRGIELRVVSLPLVRPFRTSFGEESVKEAILVRVETSDGPGWGECAAAPAPRYSEEFNESAWIVLRDHVAPTLLEARRMDAWGMREALGWIRGHRMAKAAVEMAILDAWLRPEGRSLASFLGAERDRVECGVSVGIPSSIDALLEQVEVYVREGYRRIKLKIEPGWDAEPVATVRKAFPDVPLSVDANGAYSLADVPLFESLDTLDLLMIEQPLSHEDLVDHAMLQRRIDTPVCLDESIRSAADARTAIDLGACRVINVKAGRVGGLVEATAVHDVARERGIPVWCGGMLETGVGRAANLALAALPGFTLPGDTSASDRYFVDDITEPFVLEADGTMAVPTGSGLGVDPRPDRLEACTVRVERIGR
jgi:O-succinylbenzoate synthase